MATTLTAAVLLAELALVATPRNAQRRIVRRCLDLDRNGRNER